MHKNMPKLGIVLMAAVIAAWGGWGTLSFADDDDDDDQALVEVTGQTECFDQSGSAIDCDGTGQDGEIQAGVPFPKKRFKDTGKGTVKDNLTGLIWLKNASCFVDQTWQNALNAANTLEDTGTPETTDDYGLSDGSDAGDWRLPNVKELQSLIDFGHFDPALPAGHPFSGVQSFAAYWSSTSRANLPDEAWFVFLATGALVANVKDAEGVVWPVRGGQARDDDDDE